MKTETIEEFSPARLLPNESSSMGWQIHRIMRTAIIQGTLKPGQSISEIDISKRFLVSRQPVREAFIKLSEEGLIEVLSQRGTYVRKISAKEVLDARYLREIIEVAIVREVAQQHDPAVIKELRSLIARQNQILPSDANGFLELDDEFHKILALSVNRDYAWKITDGIKAQMNRVRFLTFDSATPKTQLVCEHGDIVDAIEEGDADKAASRIEKHLRTLITSLPLIIERYPELFTES